MSLTVLALGTPHFRPVSELTSAAGRGTEQPPLGFGSELRSIDVGLQVLIEVMVAGHFVLHAAYA